MVIYTLLVRDSLAYLEAVDANEDAVAAPAPETPAPDAMPETPDPSYVASCEGCPYPDTCSWFRRCTFRRRQEAHS